MIIRESKDAPVGIRNNFMAAISSFTDSMFSAERLMSRYTLPFLAILHDIPISVNF